MSAAPSTIYALAIGSDALEATRAAGAMLVPKASLLPVLFVAAAAVHAIVSLFWTFVIDWALPRRRVLIWSVLGSAAVAVLDLRVITPVFFSSVTILAFWPQFADHLMWGACFGLTLLLCSARTYGSRCAPRLSRLDSSQP